jgi:Family of unknown function (DUF6080)
MLALGGLFWLLYLGLGLSFHFRAPRLFARIDLVFDADVPSRIIDLTRVGGAHYRTQLHPLFVLLLNPLGLLLRAGLHALGIEPAGRLAAIVLTSAAGAAGVALLFAWLRRASDSSSRSLLWTLLFGLSSSQMVFGSLPETFVFSGLSLLAVFVVVSDPDRSTAARLAASVACFGMALSNIGAVFLARADALWKGGRKAAIVAAAGLAVATVVITAPLAAFQLWLYPRTVPFYAWGGVARDDHLSFFRPTSLGDALAHAADVGAHLVLFNLAAPRLEVQGAGTQFPTVDFPDPSWTAFRPVGLPHAGLWAVLLGLAAIGLIASRDSLSPEVRAVGLWLAMNAALHSVFGVSLFLYSCQWTFAVVVLAALGTEAWVKGAPSRHRMVVAALALVVALQACANAQLFAELVSVFA